MCVPIDIKSDIMTGYDPNCGQDIRIMKSVIKAMKVPLHCLSHILIYRLDAFI